MARFLVLLLLATGAYGQIVAPVSIKDLTAGADAVVVGRQTTEVVSGGEIYLTLELDRVLSGALNPNPPLQASIRSAALRPASELTSQPLLCFLKHSEDRWEILTRVQNGDSIGQWCFPALSGSQRSVYEQQISKAADPILAEIVLALAVLGSASYLDVGQVVSAVPMEGTDAWVTMLETLSSPYARGLSVALRLRYSDPLAPEAFAALDRADLPPGFRVQVAQYFCTGYRSPNPGGIEVLGSLTAEGEDIQVRTCAALALRAIHVAATLPFLAELTQSDNSKLRLEGVQGLAEFANSGRLPFEQALREYDRIVSRSQSEFANEETLRHIIPPFPEYQKDEDYYLSYWRSWWEATKHELVE